MVKKASKRREWTPAQSSHVENTRPKENARGDDRQNSKANRRCDAAKGIQFGFVARLAGLKFPPANPKAALWT